MSRSFPSSNVHEMFSTKKETKEAPRLRVTFRIGVDTERLLRYELSENEVLLVAEELLHLGQDKLVIVREIHDENAVVEPVEAAYTPQHATPQEMPAELRAQLDTFMAENTDNS